MEPQQSEPTVTLAPGATVGGRFVIESKLETDPVGPSYLATDSKTSKAVVIRLITQPALRGTGVIDGVKAEIRLLAAKPHRALVAIFGMGTDRSGAPFVATEHIQGQTLAETFTEIRNSHGGTLPSETATQLTIQLAQALAKIHPAIVHGSLRPDVVWITDGGRVKLGDFALGAAVARYLDPSLLGDDAAGFLAPEVRGGERPTPQSDVYGLGAILYAALVGHAPAQSGPIDIDAAPDSHRATLARALTAKPSERHADVAALVGELSALSADQSGEDVPIHISVTPPPPEARSKEIVLDELSAEPISDRPPARPAITPRTNGKPAPRVGERVSIADSFRAQPHTPERASMAEVNLSDVLAKISENDAPRWMVSKSGLDHGPFSGRELVQRILTGDAQGDNLLMNMDTGLRKPILEYPEFAEFVEQYKIRKVESDGREAVVRSAKADKTSTTLKSAFAGLLVVALIGGLVTFFVTRKQREDARIKSANLADLIDRGQLQPSEGAAGILPDPPRRRGGGGGGKNVARAGGGGGGGAGGSYEEAMNDAVDLGSAANGGGEQRLSPQDVAGVMNGRLNGLFSCVSAELRNGGSLRNVQLDLAIAGSGQVLGVSVRQGSAGFQSCISGKVRQIRFPSFSAPRMGARYSFGVD